MNNIETIFIIIGAVGGPIGAFLTIIIRDATTKNSLRQKVSHLETENGTLRKIDERQDAEIRKQDHEILLLREKQQTLRERFEEFQKVQTEELKGINDSNQKMAQSYASLNATMQGIKGWLERIADKLDSKTDKRK